VAQQWFARKGAILLWGAAAGSFALSGRHDDCRDLHFVSRTVEFGQYGAIFAEFGRSTISRNTLCVGTLHRTKMLAGDQ
jgi:hypothetical protein